MINKSKNDVKETSQLYSILDCTLRDGGYVNNWEFSDECIKSVIKSLVEANVEFIECGFVNQKNGIGINSTLFKNFEQVNNILKSIDFESSKSIFCVMINKGDFDLNTLPPYDSNTDALEGIRYAFHKKDWEQAIDDCMLMVDKGYQVYVQAMVTMSYSDIEILEMLSKVNTLNVKAMYIVDSFGEMFCDDFKRLHYLFENNLREDISLGYHSHNNLQLAYSNAIEFIKIRNVNREILIDSSIHGMGRGAGNLTTELFADYLNKKHSKNYKINPLLEVIDQHLEVIYKNNYWGYSISQFLSASSGCHPNYASFLVNTKTLAIIDIQKILKQLTKKDRINFSKEKIKNLYIKYKSKSASGTNIDEEIFKNREVLILAPGPNCELQKNLVHDYIKNHDPLIISVNHIPISYSPKYFFFSNQKRFDRFHKALGDESMIITSNIQVDHSNVTLKIANYHDLVLMTKNKNDNAAILLINLLKLYEVNRIFIAGLDGYQFDKDNYVYTEDDRILDKNELLKHNQNVSKSLFEIRSNISLNILTDSIFNK